MFFRYDILRIICFLLTLFGGILMVITTVKYGRLLKNVNVQLQLPRYVNAIKNVLRFMLIFFIFSFVIGALDIFTREVEPIYYFVITVSFIGSVFVFLLVEHLSLLSTANSRQNARLHGALKQIANHNQHLQVEVEAQVHEIMHQDKLLHTSNEIAGILQATEVEDFDRLLIECMGMLGKSVDVDRVYIWKNYVVDGTLYCTQLYEWSEFVDPQQGNELTVEIPYSKNMPGWEATLSSGQSVRGMVRDLSEAEQRQLSPQSILSILVVPVFLQEQFWGFVGFDDCRNEREFSDAEENILRSTSFLIATALLRNEMTLNLVAAREEALSSTKAKSNFLSNMSHEIRTPLNAITGMTAIARKADSLDKIHDSLGKIDAASRQLLGIINDILDMSKIEAGKMEMLSVPFNMHAMLANIKSITGVQASARDQHLEFKISDDLPQIFLGDELRLSQILLNLLANAVKFSPENGNISLSIRLIGETDGIYDLEAQVRDNGIGIAPELQGRLFQAFEQADSGTAHKYGGTGLGLAISARIAALMDGGISVQSTPGQGSCFTVRVRLATVTEGSAYNALAMDSISTDAFKGKIALLVEDIAVNREIVLSVFDEWGIVADCAENGEDAVGMFLKNPDKYNIIFMDIYMPVLDGYEATKKIRALEHPRAASIPIVAMTANAFSEDVQKCLEAGMDAHIAKPIDVARLRHVINKFIVYPQ